MSVSPLTLLLKKLQSTPNKLVKVKLQIVCAPVTSERLITILIKSILNERKVKTKNII